MENKKQILFSRTSKITGKTIVGIVKYIDERHIISENGTLYELHEVEFNNKYIRQIKMKKLFIN